MFPVFVYQGTIFDVHLEVPVFYRTDFELYHLERFRRAGIEDQGQTLYYDD